MQQMKMLIRKQCDTQNFDEIVQEIRFIWRSHRASAWGRSPDVCRLDEETVPAGGFDSEHIRDELSRMSNFLAKCCSFSAVSAPIFASKYAFCSILQNLPDFLAKFFEIWQNFAKISTFANVLLNFYENC